MMGGRPAGGSRDLRTVLFTDIVGSTEQAAQLGDRAWGQLLARHHAVVRAALKATGGHEMDTAGDGFFATFARPTDALACARAIVAGVAALGLAVRVGVHAGEVETREGKAGGLTVLVAARLMAAAGSDEVLVSATVRDLAGGAGWSFADRGQLTLKGLAEPVHAYALDLAAAAPALATGRVGLGAAIADRAGSRWLIGAAVVVVVVVVTLAGGAGHPAATPTTVAGASPSAMLSPTPSSAPSPSAAVIAAFGVGFPAPVPIAPGQYRAVALRGSPTLTIADEGWSVSASNHINLSLARTTSPEDRFAIYWPTNLATDLCASKAPVAIGPDPEAQFLAWLRTATGLRLSPPRIRQFGDLGTTEYDISIIDAAACQTTDPISVSITPCTAPLTDACIALDSGVRQRLEVSSRDSKLILILIEAPSAAEFDTLAPLAEKILSTLTFPPESATQAP
ncbi:MAG: adenylate/guanylate cyclase domain-containing protein [Candidatus Limnocylindrales bacterium]